MPHLFQVATKGIILKDNKALVLRGTIERGPEQGKIVWDLPGGRIEENESIHQALKREVTEELPGINNIVIGKLLIAGRDFHREDQVSLIVLYYLLTVELTTISLSHEHHDYRWIDQNQLNQFNLEPPTNFFNNMRAALDIALKIG